MIRVFIAVLSVVLLAGCGALPATSPAQGGESALSAQSKSKTSFTELLVTADTTRKFRQQFEAHGKKTSYSYFVEILWLASRPSASGGIDYLVTGPNEMGFPMGAQISVSAKGEFKDIKLGPASIVKDVKIAALPFEAISDSDLAKVKTKLDAHLSKTSTPIKVSSLKAGSFLNRPEGRYYRASAIFSNAQDALAFQGSIEIRMNAGGEVTYFQSLGKQ